MKIFLALLLSLQCLIARAEGWTTTDTAYQAVLTLELYEDCRQTQEIAQSPVRHEVNPLLGPRPSAVKVRNYFLLSAVAEAGIAYSLPEGMRRSYQTLAMTFEFYVIKHNVGTGFKLVF